MSAQAAVARTVPPAASVTTLAASKYRAFISYSHRDEKWAAWLHSALETYRIPKSLIGQTTTLGAVPPRLSPVFRDREELPTATDLGSILTQALRDSAFQIVICSPAAARSHWVNEEVLTFKRLGRADRVLCLIVGGEPYSGTADEAFPAAVRFNVGADGALSNEPAEPIAADVRPGKDGRTNALLKIVAGMLGVGLDVLKQREHARRQRRLMVVASAAVAGMTVTSVLAATAWFARIEADAQRVRAEAEAETARQTTNFMVDLFKISDPSESLGNSITAREILDKGAARIELELADQPQIQATLMDTMGSVYTGLGLYSQGASLLERALQTRTTTLGAEHVEVASSLNNLGEVLMFKADYDAAAQRLREALEIRRRQLGEPHPLVAKSLADLADVLTLQGKYAEAKPLIDEALAMRREIYGDEGHADVAESLEDLGYNYYYLADYPRALENMRAALEMRRAVHPAVHPDLAQALNNLALMLYETGDYAAARALYEESLGMFRILLGPEHKEVATALRNVGLVLQDQGDLAGAEANYREALRMQTKLLGNAHPDVVGTMNNLAFVLYDAKRVSEAIAMLREAHSLAGPALGADHPDVAAIATNLGFWLTQEGDYEDALSLLDRALEIRRLAFGENHPQYASTLSIKANLLLATHEYAAARDAARAARLTLTQSLSEDHWRVAMAASAEGAALTELGDFASAKTLLTRSTDVLSQGGAAMELLSQQSRERLERLNVVSNK